MKKIALIGSAPSSVHIAPYDNPEWEVWACSPGSYGIARNVKRFFELHRYEPGQPWFSEGYCDFLQNFEGTLYVSQADPRLPNSTVIPWNALVEKYGPYFFTSSLAWMIAMAIEEGATTIGLWGVDMAATEEYGYQRAGCQYFAMLAKSMGIEFGVPPESDLLRPAPLYGVGECSHSFIKNLARQRELEMRLQDAQARKSHAEKEEHFLQGAIDDLNWSQNTWHGNGGMMDDNFTEPPAIPVLDWLNPQQPGNPEEVVLETRLDDIKLKGTHIFDDYARVVESSHPIEAFEPLKSKISDDKTVGEAIDEYIKETEVNG